MKYLTVAFVIGLVLVAVYAFGQSQPGPVKRVGADQFDQLRQATNTIVLDVRTEGEFRAGHLPGAVNLNVNDGDFETRIARLDKTKTYLVHCQSGGRSRTACARLVSAGVTNLYELEPGFRGWQAAGKPVER